MEWAKENEIFEYGGVMKKRNFILTVFILLLLLLLVGFYFLFLRFFDFYFISLINSFFAGIANEVQNLTLTGAVYTSFFGGLFFVFMPLEIVFILFLGKGYSPALLTTIYLIGIVASYSINYFIGMKVSSFSKKVITYKKFYQIKSLLNKYGAWLIFVFNAFPFPSQPLSAILGVFKYSKPKFIFFVMLGQFVKYLVISLSYIYII